VAAPFLLAYLLWVFQRAKDLGLRRLYFVARDGQVFAELAAILNRRLNWNLETRYLYASRQTVNLAAVYEASADELEWVCRQGDHVSLASLMRRLDLELSEVAPAVELICPGELSASTRVTDDLRKRLVVGMESGPLREFVLQKAAARREGVLAFLRQEGLLDGMRIGIVDIGGVGSQARALHRLCTRSGQPPPRFFFIGLDGRQNSGLQGADANADWLQDAECYIFDYQRGQGLPSFGGLVTTVQMFCAADHGTVLAYEQCGSRIEPVLETDHNRDVQAWGLSLVRQTLRQFVGDVVLDDELVDRAADLRNAVCEGIREFWRRPTVEEANVWGAFPFEGAEMISPTVKALARPYSWSDVVQGVVSRGFLNGSFPDRSWNSWHEGSMRVTPTALRRTIRLVERSAGAFRSGDPRAEKVRAVANWLRARLR
jgi:hypothetical protein